MGETLSMDGHAAFRPLPRTAALRRALRGVRDDASAVDLLFLESWEVNPAPVAV